MKEEIGVDIEIARCVCVCESIQKSNREEEKHKKLSLAFSTRWTLHSARLLSARRQYRFGLQCLRTCPIPWPFYLFIHNLMGI